MIIQLYQFIPNFLTLCNLFFGAVGITLAFKGQLIEASYCILISAGFDFFDGFIARLLKVYSAIGKELDSLADLISFGLLPSVLVFNLLEQELNYNAPIIYAVYGMTLLSAYRLAAFNIDNSQESSFKGLPTPANALFWGGIVHIIIYNQALNSLFNSPFSLLVFSLIMALLLISPIRLFALKFKNFNFKDNRLRYIFLLSAAPIIIIKHYAGAVDIIILYILLSLISTLRITNH